MDGLGHPLGDLGTNPLQITEDYCTFLIELSERASLY